MTELLDHAAYRAAAPEALRPQLAVFRDRLKQALPDAEEVMQYGMPGFTSGGVMIAGYGAFSKQCGLYVSKGAINAHADDIAAAKLKASKTGVTFSPTKPIPHELITALAVASRKDAAV
ncbi:DUF1801 domain-containing protein [Georhizobium profundi]|uniref:DUF1801 domain-containing protein n=1 Tax=Georhizobium profundi TaxID=2341112 RepID=A0A3Q8XSS8_9HYPH|nr:DUF1801 domain-containing protein [Georhizobium profundi]AZN72882.1 DUF1801 domain-containing protein [Georhizobium profundi]